MASKRATYDRTGSPNSPLARKRAWFPSSLRTLSICSCLASSSPLVTADSTMLPSHDE